eukprot:gene12199-14408_t
MSTNRASSDNETMSTNRTSNDNETLVDTYISNSTIISSQNQSNSSSTESTEVYGYASSVNDTLASCAAFAADVESHRDYVGPVYELDKVNTHLHELTRDPSTDFDSLAQEATDDDYWMGVVSTSPVALLILANCIVVGVMVLVLLYRNVSIIHRLLNPVLQFFFVTIPSKIARSCCAPSKQASKPVAMRPSSKDSAYGALCLTAEAVMGIGNVRFPSVVLKLSTLFTASFNAEAFMDRISGNPSIFVRRLLLWVLLLVILAIGLLGWVTTSIGTDNLFNGIEDTQDASDALVTYLDEANALLTTLGDDLLNADATIKSLDENCYFLFENDLDTETFSSMVVETLDLIIEYADDGSDAMEGVKTHAGFTVLCLLVFPAALGLMMLPTLLIMTGLFNVLVKVWELAMGCCYYLPCVKETETVTASAAEGVDRATGIIKPLIKGLTLNLVWIVATLCLVLGIFGADYCDQANYNTWTFATQYVSDTTDDVFTTELVELLSRYFVTCPSQSSFQEEAANICFSFGTDPVPAFGTDQVSDFGTDLVSAFCTDPVSAFGTDLVSAFCTDLVLAFGTDPVSAFGTDPVPAFSTDPVSDFGTDLVLAFGTDRVSDFGTDLVSAFCTDPVPAFGTDPVSAFGTDRVSAFGTDPVPAFGTDPVPAFGTDRVSASSMAGPSGEMMRLAWNGRCDEFR